MMRFAEIRDNKAVLALDAVPVLEEKDFLGLVDEMMIHPSNHLIHYFAFAEETTYRLFCIIGCDEEHVIRIFSQRIKKDAVIPAVTARHYAFHVFERDMHEQEGIQFSDHPWLKPLRSIHNYPFYSIDSEELHEVGVGPVHAGVIEPGHFRFICNGEKVLHLEISLGYQHRGLEDLFLKKDSLLKQMILSESIAGDTTVGHAMAFASLTETAAGFEIPDDLLRQRMIALELERIAVHIGDTAALCTDTAYQFGQVVCEALRTIVINTTQLWCGNRFGKGLIRPGGTHYPLTKDLIPHIKKNISEVIERYEQIAYKIFSIPSVLNRFEGTGRISSEQACLIGAVGMAARSTGLKRDVRWSFPGRQILKEEYQPATFIQGDVWARGMVRREEVHKSFRMVMELLDQLENSGLQEVPSPVSAADMQKNSLVFALTEGWRGEICHAAITGDDGRFSLYKVKDPSMHNWMALALAVRNQEISDFPLCNKSFNLSYCGHDL